MNEKISTLLTTLSSFSVQKVHKSQSVEVLATSMDPPHSYLSCIFLADLSQNISLSVL